MWGKHLCCPRLKPGRASKTTPPISKTFNSLYDSTTTESEGPSGSGSTSRTLAAAGSGPGCSDSGGLDLSSVFASRRLTRPASTGRSNSIIEEDVDEERMKMGYGPVPKMSPDPYADFKRSMEEMVEALGIEKMEAGGGDMQMRMQELLLCYLALNRKNAHQFIVCAFADVFRVRVWPLIETVASRNLMWKLSALSKAGFSMMG